MRNDISTAAGEPAPKRRRKRAAVVGPPPDVDWTIPGDRLRIYDAVKWYIGPRWLRNGFRGNPYKVSRHYVVLALAQADLSERNANVLRRQDEELARCVTKARELADSIQKFQSDEWWFVALTSGAVRGTSRELASDQMVRFDKIDEARRALAPAEQALRTIAEEAQGRLNRKDGRAEDKDEFMTWFIEPLAFGWTNLSKRKLRPHSHHFGWFVERAVDTLLDGPRPERFYLYADALKKLAERRSNGLRRKDEARKRQLAGGGDPDKYEEKPWTEHQCSVVLNEMKRRPRWDRPDRYLNNAWPPDPEPETEEQAFERRKCGDMANNDIRDAVRAMELGGPDAVGAANRLTHAAGGASAQERDRYYALGFHPDIAMAVRFGAGPWPRRS
jgi:hypothetical protein